MCRRPDNGVCEVAGNGAALGDCTRSTTLTIADNVWFDGRVGHQSEEAVISGTDPSGNPVAQLVTGLPLTQAVKELP